MKKLLAAMLCAVMVLTLGGCGLWDVIPTKSPTDVTESQTETKEDRTTKAETETSAKPSSEETQDETHEHAMVGVQNSGFYSMGGTCAQLGEYTYFVVEGLNNDCQENGLADSADIYRIKNELNAEPEPVWSAPSPVFAGTSQDRVFYLAGGSGGLWFIDLYDESSDFVCLSLLDPETLEVKTYPLDFSPRQIHNVFYTGSLFFDNASYYFVLSETNSDNLPVFSLRRFDTASRQCEKIDLSPLSTETKIASVVTVSHDMIYYCLYDVKADGWVSGLYRADIRNLVPQEIASIDVEAELEEAEFCYAAENYLYYSANDSLCAIRYEDGKKLTVLTEAEGFTEEYFATCLITDEEIVFASEEGLFLADPEGKNIRTIAEDAKLTTKMGLFKSGDFYYYSLHDHPQYTRIAKNGRIFQENPLVLMDNSMVRREEEGEWSYEVYPNFIRIVGYNGDSTELHVPDSLEGVPVRSITNWNKEDYTGVSALILPEGLYGISYLHADGVTRIELPKSLQVFTHRGFTYSFRTDTETTFVYPGTLEEFEAICKRSREQYADMGIDANCGDTHYILECADGIFTCEPSAAGEEVFAPYEETEDILIKWLGIWEAESGEKLEIDVADEDTGLQLLYHGFTAAGSSFETAYDFGFENDEMTIAGEDKSVEERAGWRYQLILDPDNDTITMKSRYPDKLFEKVD